MSVFLPMLPDSITYSKTYSISFTPKSHYDDNAKFKIYTAESRLLAFSLSCIGSTTFRRGRLVAGRLGAAD